MSHEFKNSVTVEIGISIFPVIHEEQFPLPHHCGIFGFPSVASAAQPIRVDVKLSCLTWGVCVVAFIVLKDRTPQQIICLGR
jgi:hypothetical protein